MLARGRAERGVDAFFFELVAVDLAALLEATEGFEAEVEGLDGAPVLLIGGVARGLGLGREEDAEAEEDVDVGGLAKKAKRDC